jgi:phosphoribosylglycinamide formyltransferase-1
MKKFSIYCSGNASRVIKFYSYKNNRNLFCPSGIFYDGQNRNIQKTLKSFFDDKVFYFNHDKLKTDELKRINLNTSNKLLKFLIKNKSEYLLCFGNKILKNPLIEKYNRRIINFHPSLLPSFKGLNAVDQALKAKVSFLGNTAHFIDEGVDTGEIIMQSAMLRSDFGDYEDLLELQFPMLNIIFRDLFGFKTKKLIDSEILQRNKPYFLDKKLKNIDQ